MLGWHHQPNGHEFEQTLGDSEEQGNLVRSCSWVTKSSKESDMTERLNNNNNSQVEFKVKMSPFLGLNQMLL